MIEHPTDEQADAAHRAWSDYVSGAEVALSHRDLAAWAEPILPETYRAVARYESLKVADAIMASPEWQGRPAAQEDDEAEFAPGECTGARDCDAPMHIHGCFAPHRADQCDAPDEYGHIDPAAQPVVTDEMVERAARAAYENAFLKHAPEDVDRWDDLAADNDPAADSWRAVARAALDPRSRRNHDRPPRQAPRAVR